MLKNGRVLFEEFDGGGGKVEVAFVRGGGGYGKRLGRLRDDQGFEGKELFEVFLFFNCIVKIWISPPFDSSIQKGPELEQEVELRIYSAEKVTRLGRRNCEESHSNYALLCSAHIPNKI